MSGAINAGGPAFPHGAGAVFNERAGMTLRDYFAAKAMQGICAQPETWGHATNGIAMLAYDMADAMLKAREGGAA